MDAESLVRESIGPGRYTVTRPNDLDVLVEVSGDVTLTFEILGKLSRAFYTPLIDLEYEASTGPYITPGERSSFRIRIRCLRAGA